MRDVAVRFTVLVGILVVFASALVPTADPLLAAQIAPATTATATTTDALNLRSGPALSETVIAVIPMGSKVILTGQKTDGFSAVTFNGRSGWAFATYLSIDAPTPSPNATATTTAGLNLRAGPGTSYAVRTVLPVGAVVTLTGQNSNRFASVTWAGYSGWASIDYLVTDTPSGPPTPTPAPSPSTTPAPTPAPSTTPAPPVVTNNASVSDTVNLRSGPGVSYGVIAVMPKGSRIVVTSNLQGGFRQVSFEGRTGWASDAYIVADGVVPAPGETARTTDSLNLRSGPDTASSVLAIIPAGATVQLTGQRTNGFRSVRYDGVTGWAFEAYLIVGTPTTPPTPGGPTVPTTAFDVTNTIVGPARGSVDQALAFARGAGALRFGEVELYVREVYRLAPEIGFDPALLVAQSAHETENWTSSWWHARLNPAGIGVTGDPWQNSESPFFSNGTMAARAQIAHMHAEVFGSSRPLPTVLQGADSTYQRVFEAGWAGTIRTVADLQGTWATDPAYDTKLVRKANEIFR